MARSICNKWFTIVVAVSITPMIFLLMTYSAVDMPKTQHYRVQADEYLNGLVKEEITMYPKKPSEAEKKPKEGAESDEEINIRKGEWRHFSKEQIDSLSNVGRLLYLGEPQTPVNDSSKYTILIWKHGKTLENRHIKHWTSDTQFDPFEKCSVNNCELTYEDGDLEKAHGVIFHMQRIPNPNFLPQGPRNQKQRWIFLTDETPYHTFLSGKDNHLWNYDGLFNWSMTYRMDSDVPVPYGRTITAEENFKVDLVYGDWTSGKKNDVLLTIMTSNCGSKNHRLQYVKELQKTIPVDIYGACGPLKCPGHFTKDCELIRNYKFYLAFENSNCPQYITEKVWWNAYAKNAIPIVMGASKEEYKQLLPPESYIHVDDFANPSDLGRYILYLNSTPYQFERYFKWRQDFRVLNEHAYFQTDSFHYCRVCEALNFNDRSEKIYKDLKSFWNKDQCRMGWDENRLQLDRK